MAENSNNNEELEQKQGNLKNHARSSAPSFNSKNKYKEKVQSSPIAQAKKTVLKEGIKKAAQYYGVPEIATEQVLKSEVGDKVLDAAASQPTITGGVHEATKVLTWETVIKPTIVGICVVIALLFSFLVLIGGKDAFGGMGGEDDIYADLREEIGDVVKSYRGKGEVNGTLIMATLIAYNDNEELEEPGTVAKNMTNMKKQVSKLASYQIMTIDDCSYDSSTMRKIASNDDILSEANYSCVPGSELSYKVSYTEGNFDDDNSGSVYYWNLIDEDFIFEYYNEYMINKEDNTSANEEKIKDIIAEIYSYYEILLAENNGKDYFAFYLAEGGYWWPIGSNDTTIENGKVFARGEPARIKLTARIAGNDAVHKGAHGAIDIAGTKNVTNVIATRAGTVIYPSNESQIRFPDGCHPSVTPGCTRNKDGGGFGNYVIIDHGDGVYSYYGHMYADTITVFAGDTVEQGQVIGKVGTSGSSTGPHLHFEIRDGGMAKSFRVDPLEYVDPENPRPSGASIIEWLKVFEGGTSGKYVDGNNYVVYDGGDGVLTVGYGIVIVDRSGYQLYTSIYNVPVKVGSRVPMEAVDKMFALYMADGNDKLNKAIAKYGVTLTQYQRDSMLSFMYNCGKSYADKLVKAYAEGGSEGYWNFIKGHTISYGRNLYGLKVRRAEEYELFLTGDYKRDPLSWKSGDPVKYYDKKSW